jgi:spoIIIJ-associated protein
VEQAAQRALAELDIAPGELEDDEFEVRIIVAPVAGFLGVGGTDAEVEVRLLTDDLPLTMPEDHLSVSAVDDEEEPETETMAFGEAPGPGSARLRELLTTIMSKVGVSGSIHIVEKAEVLTADISGDDLGILIGKRGQTLDAIEYVANIALYPHPAARKRVLVDVQGYKERRQQSIERVALKRAEEVIRRRRPVQLEPMTAAERKIVHLALKEWVEVVTESQGREPHRAVVISPSR